MEIIMKFIITDPLKPKLDINSQEEAHEYNIKISQLDIPDFSLEVNNVLAAKNNLNTTPASMNDVKNMELSSCINDKILILFGHICGHENVQSFSGGLKKFFEVVSEIDFAVSTYKLGPLEHGTEVIREVRKLILDKSVDIDNYLNFIRSLRNKGS
jgi:hypothetical protein